MRQHEIATSKGDAIPKPVSVRANAARGDRTRGRQIRVAIRSSRFRNRRPLRREEVRTTRIQETRGHSARAIPRALMLKAFSRRGASVGRLDSLYGRDTPDRSASFV